MESSPLKRSHVDSASADTIEEDADKDVPQKKGRFHCASVRIFANNLVLITVLIIPRCLQLKRQEKLQKSLPTQKVLLLSVCKGLSYYKMCYTVTVIALFISEVILLDDSDFAAALECSSTQVVPPKKNAKKRSGKSGLFNLFVMRKFYFK